MFAAAYLTFDPVAPWSSTAGVAALAVVVLFIAGMTALTYLLGQRGSWRRFLTVLALRLAALVVICVLILRPALAHVEEVVVPSKLLLVIDVSQSMEVRDEFNGQSRWENVLRLLRSESVQRALKKLQNEQRVEIVYYQAAEDVARFNPDGKADGKRTDMGWWLHYLFELHGKDKDLRGVLLVSDGADNGVRFLAVDEAKRWRGIGCPVHALGLGSTKTTPNRLDVYFDPNQISATPSPVYVKGKLKVRAVVHAPGMFGLAPLRLLINDKEVATKDVHLLKDTGNEVEIETDAPETPGDYKVTLKIDPRPGEISDQNNEISTYVTVAKEGLSVLWVEGKKRLESVWAIKHALKNDPRIRVYYAERPKTAAPEKAGADWFEFAQRRYDVIVIGDISAERFFAGDPQLLNRIRKMVSEEKTGILMVGGFETLSAAESDWSDPQYKNFTDMLPVVLGRHGQIEGAVQVAPTVAGFDHYVLRLTDDPTKNPTMWAPGKLFRSLPGATRLGKVRDEGTVLATASGEPLMAFRNFGKGRVVVFGGDTTHQAWTHTPEAFAAYQRFWNRLIRWLAWQEAASGDVFVKLDTRRLPAGSNQRLGITVGLRDEKPELRNQKVKFNVTVAPPRAKEGKKVDTFAEGEGSERKERGYFWQTNVSGEYVVTAEALDEKGKRIGEPATVRFLAYSEDLENLHPAANHDHLARIAQAGGGQFRLAGEHELALLFRELGQQITLQSQTRSDVWPDWNREPASSAVEDQVLALWHSGVLLWYPLFCTLLCVEWYLRRRWSMV